MSQTVSDGTVDPISESARQTSHATSSVADATREDGVGVEKRGAKEGSDAAEEFLNDTTQGMRRHRVLSIAVTFAVIGFSAAALIGWMIKRR